MSDLKNLSNAFVQTVQNLENTVLQVKARRRMPATGFVWSDDGLVVTANHVVEFDSDIEVNLNEQTFSASLIGRDPYNDLALLKIDQPLNLQAAQIANAQVGQLVLALARPADDINATLGVVSAIVQQSKSKPQRESRYNSGSHMQSRGRGRGGRGSWGRGRVLSAGYIQTDVTMYPGFSGGPLVNANNEVLGMNTSGFSQGVSIALPSQAIRASVISLAEHGQIRYAYLGVGTQSVALSQDIAEEAHQRAGLIVLSVADKSPAKKAGLLVGDILLTIEDESVQTVDELLLALHAGRIDQQIELSLVRAGQIISLSVTVDTRPDSE